MRVFVTGASGWVGSAVVPELIAAGHEVTGLARSDASADALTAAGARVRRGSLDDIDSLRAGAADADGVIHLAFKHDFGDFAAAGAADLNAVQAMGDVLAGSGRPLVTASGTLVLAMIAPGRPGTEDIVAYVGDGANRWPAVHRLDAARLFRLALEKAPAGSVLHAAGDPGIPFTEIADAIGGQLGHYFAAGPRSKY